MSPDCAVPLYGVGPALYFIGCGALIGAGIAYLILTERKPDEH